MPVGTARDHELAEVLLGLEADHRAQRELARPRLEPPRRQLDVLAAQCVLDVGDGELPRRERLAVDPDPHRIAARAVDTHARHARHGREPVEQVALGVVGELEHRHRVGAEAERHDGIAARVGLDDLRRVRVLRQARDDPGDAIAHVVRGRVDVAAHVELDAHLRALVLAVGLYFYDPLDARDRVLDDLRDLRLDHGRRCAAVVRGDRDDRPLDVRILAYREPLQRHDAEDHEQHAHDGGENRAANRELGELHERVNAIGASCTGVPSRMFCVPSTTTRSFSARPSTTSTSPGRRLPVCTSRRSTTPFATTNT